MSSAHFECIASTLEGLHARVSNLENRLAGQPIVHSTEILEKLYKDVKEGRIKPHGAWGFTKITNNEIHGMDLKDYSKSFVIESLWDSEKNKEVLTVIAYGEGRDHDDEIELADDTDVLGVLRVLRNNYPA